MVFSKLTDDNINILREYLPYQRFRTCDYSMGGLYMWRNYFDMYLCVINDTLIFKVNFPGRGESFTFPVGKGDKELALKALAENNNGSLRLCTVPLEGINKINEFFPTTDYKISLEPFRDWADYLYDIETFCSFSGKKLHGQRNHLNKFLSLYPNYSFETLSDKNVSDAILFLEEYYSCKREDIASAASLDGKSALEKEDAIRCFEVLLKFELFPDFFGGLIKVNSKIVGLTLGEIIDDTLYVHIEKGNTEYSGIYQVLSMEYARYAKNKGALYSNREDDSGDIGLRKSKLDYNPIALLEKYFVDIKRIK